MSFTAEVDTNNGTQRATGWLEILNELARQPLSPTINMEAFPKGSAREVLGGNVAQCLRCLKVTLEPRKLFL